MEQYRWLIGIDWGDRAHHVCALTREGGTPQRRVFAHEATALHELGEWLERLCAGDLSTVAVGIETPHGPVVEALLERGVAVYAINPKQLDRFRDRHSVAGAKDDSRDAFVLANSLRTDQECFRRVVPADPIMVQLREVSRVHETLKDDCVALSNRLRQVLYRYFPQLLKLSPAAEEPWLWALLERAPTPAQAARLRPSQVARLLREHRISRFTAEEVVAILRAPALPVASGTVAAVTRHVALLLPQLRLLHEQRHAAERQLAELLRELEAKSDEEDGPGDVRIVCSWPGVGNIVAATLFAEAWQALHERDRTTLRTHGGAAPITRATGTGGRPQPGRRRRRGETVVMRRGCNDRLRNAFHYWGQTAVQHDPRAKAQFARLRAAGHSYARALRGVVDRLLDGLLATLKARTLYDPARRSVGNVADAFRLVAASTTA
jgi:hypothetical protein